MLALALGMPLGQMLRSMTSYELTLWKKFHEVDPFGSWREDYRAGTVAAAVYNVERSKPSQPVILPDAFIPQFITKADQDRIAAEQAKRDTATLKSLFRQAGQEAAAVAAQAKKRK